MPEVIDTIQNLPNRR
jgi:hypothetical protein